MLHISDISSTTDSMHVLCGGWINRVRRGQCGAVHTEHMSGSWGSQGTDETLLRSNQTRRGRQKVRGRKREREPPQDRHCLFIFPLRSSGARCPWKIAK